jgi:hypothetical protein
MTKTTAKEPIYRITYTSQGKVIELYARNVYQGGMYGFIEVEELLFEEQESAILIDPEIEKLRSEFENVEITFIPLHAVLRIDQVSRSGSVKIRKADSDSKTNVSYLPGLFPPHKPSPEKE